MTANVPEVFGSLVFNQKTMKDRLPKETFKALKKTLDDGGRLKKAQLTIHTGFSL